MNMSESIAWLTRDYHHETRSMCKDLLTLIESILLGLFFYPARRNERSIVGLFERMIMPLGGNIDLVPRIEPEKAPLVVARRLFGITKTTLLAPAGSALGVRLDWRICRLTPRSLPPGRDRADLVRVNRPKYNPIILMIILFLTGCSGTMPKLGINNGQLMPCPKTPNCVNSQAADEKHAIESIHFSGTQKEAQAALSKILKTRNRTKIIAAEKDYIRVEFTSMIFRFVDDVEFYFPLTEAGKTVIHVRSASRVGYSDFGVNRKRIETIRRELIVK
jgi:uncharacterized protein (DUF1499 family)